MVERDFGVPPPGKNMFHKTLYRSRRSPLPLGMHAVHDPVACISREQDIYQTRYLRFTHERETIMFNRRSTGEWNGVERSGVVWCGVVFAYLKIFITVPRIRSSMYLDRHVAIAGKYRPMHVSYTRNMNNSLTRDGTKQRPIIYKHPLPRAYIFRVHHDCDGYIATLVYRGGRFICFVITSRPFFSFITLLHRAIVYSRIVP